jgi:hypothetical protein
MSEAQLKEYVTEIMVELIARGTLDDDYPDMVNTIIVEIVERDGLSDTECELIYFAYMSA